MALIAEQALKREVGQLGAAPVADRLCEALEKGEINYRDMPTFRQLFEALVVSKANGKELAGKTMLDEGTYVKEDAASFTSSDAFVKVCSQLFFNMLTTMYNSADYSVSKLFKVIPSTLIKGETFGGISNLAKVTEPVPFGKELPHMEPTEDYSLAPPQQRFGGIIDLTFDMLAMDRTGETMNMAEKMIEAGLNNREVNACNVLIDNMVRARYNWKDTGAYATYSAGPATDAAPWINLVGSNPLTDTSNVQAAYLALQNILDPFTGLPIATPPGKAVMIVTPENLWKAANIKKGVQYRGQSGSANFATLITGNEPPVDFDVVESKFLRYVLQQASQAETHWFFGYPQAALSRQQSMDVIGSQALPGSYSLWSKGIAASYKYETVFAHYWFNPRYMVKNTVAA